MRRRVGAIAGVLLGMLFAAILAPLATCERWLGLTRPLAAGDVAPISVRLPDGDTLREPALAGRLLVVRGQVLDAERAATVNDLHARLPRLRDSHIALAAVFGLIGLLLSAYMRTSRGGRLLRKQLTVLGLIAVLAIATKTVLLFTPLSPFLVPTAAAAMLAAVLVDRHTGFGVAVAAGLIVAALMPFDATVAIVLCAQGLGAVLAFPRGKRRRSFLVAGFVGGCAAAGAYVAAAYLYGAPHPELELGDPLRSPLVASFIGGLLAAPLAVLLRALVERIGGEIPRVRLIELADLENPLLKQIAAAAPGTWQHSLAMANMAEIAANAIGANALLARVGAYYHDLGKSLQPQYYIENVGHGQKSPHEELAPELSADAIFSHVTEGVRMARAHGIPPGIIDFMHMHHGDGLLEYFWAKCQEQGNPHGLTEAAFRYPGIKPQSRETAILAICDAVEAASRTLRKGDVRAIEQLVQRIVYGKLHNGQLDESGLTVAELKQLANTLVDMLKHAHHGRIEYPWQREEREREAAAPLPPARVVARAETAGRYVLDSADSPRAGNGGNGNGGNANGGNGGNGEPDSQVIPLVRRRPPPA
jgi:putative nucleotidyltransferase with HDIG domain